LFGHLLDVPEGVETFEIGSQFLQAEPHAGDTELDCQSDGDHRAAEGGHGDHHVLQQVDSQAHHFGGAHAGIERVLQKGGHTGAQRLNPGWSPGVQERHEDQELQSVHEDAGGGEVAVLTGLFHAPLCRLLCLLLVGHDVNE